MSAKSSIEWTDATWTPVRARVKENAREIAAAKGYGSLIQIATKMAGHVGPHCEKVSPGCERCYSEHANCRCLPSNGTGLPFDRRSRELVDIFLDEKILIQPLYWKKPRRIFVCSQTDWCAEFVTDEMRDRMLAIAALTPQHTYQFLTKRADNLERYTRCGRGAIVRGRAWTELGNPKLAKYDHHDVCNRDWPMPNVWLGVSVESRDYLHRIDHLRKTPAAIRFLSLEPLLEDLGGISAYLKPEEGLAGYCFDIDGNRWHRHGACPHCRPGIDWVIVGGESGPGARPMNIAWVRSIRDQCAAAGVPFFMKQWGEHVPAVVDGDTWKTVDGQPWPSNPLTPHDFGDGFGAIRFTKKKAGRQLDGRTWDEMPEMNSNA